MAANGRLSDKQVTAWFGELGIDRQMSVLDGLTSVHDKAKNARISELKRELSVLEKREARNSEAKSNGKRSRKATYVTVKYRDPVTGETWAGRGRMAGWLSAKKKAGEKITKYLVK